MVFQGHKAMCKTFGYIQAAPVCRRKLGRIKAAIGGTLRPYVQYYIQYGTCRAVYQLALRMFARLKMHTPHNMPVCYRTYRLLRFEPQSGLFKCRSLKRFKKQPSVVLKTEKLYLISTFQRQCGHFHKPKVEIYLPAQKKHRKFPTQPLAATYTFYTFEHKL